MTSSQPCSLTHVLLLLLLPSVISTNLTTVSVPANNLSFQCTEVNRSSDNRTINVMLLHGFPNSRHWYDALLGHWSTTTVASNQDLEFHAIACDLRGYSEGAKPNGLDFYDNYTYFALDVLEIATAAFGDSEKFHLVGHDHGAILGWLMASKFQDVLQSYTAMSIPHLDLFSEALCSVEGLQDDQVIASNYFNQWSQPDFADQPTASSLTFALGFATVEDMQKAMFWYYGSFPQHVALPRVVNVSDLDPAINFVSFLARQTYPMDVRDCIPQEKPIGKIHLPVLYICGPEDPFVLCDKPMFVSSEEEKLPNFQYFGADTCGHDFFDAGHCADPTASAAVIERITDFILSQEMSPNTAAPVVTSTAQTTSPTMAPSDMKSAAAETFQLSFSSLASLTIVALLL